MENVNEVVENVVEKVEDVKETVDIIDEGAQLTVDTGADVSKADVAIYIAVGLLSVLGITKLYELIRGFFRKIKKKVADKKAKKDVDKHPENYESAENYVTEEEAKKEESETPQPDNSASETETKVETPKKK